MSAPNVPGQLGAEWDEAQCTSALALLEQLQAQIDDLRLAIPRVIEPFHQPPNPAMFKMYKQGVEGSQNGIKALQEEWRKPETQGMFEHTRKSVAANPDLSASASTPSHGWTERARKDRDSKKNNRSESKDEDTLTGEEINQIIDEVRDWPNLRVESQDDNHTILWQFVAASVKLKFRIMIERDANGNYKLNGECLGATDPFVTITRCIASRPQTNNLRYLLNMIVSYKNVKGKKCDKCGNLLDKRMATPMARRIKQVPAANGTTEPVWEAFHESCLD